MRPRRGTGGEKGVKEASLASCNFCIPCTQAGNYELKEGVTSFRQVRDKKSGEKEREGENDYNIFKLLLILSQNQ